MHSASFGETVGLYNRIANLNSILTTTSKPKTVRSSFLIRKLAALVTSSRSMQCSVAFESTEFGFGLLVGKDLRL